MSINKRTQKRGNQYAKLFRNLKERTVEPASDPAFLIYFLIVLVVISPYNVWVELYTYVVLERQGDAATVAGPASEAPLKGLRTALLTFFPPVAVGTAMQLVWADDGKSMKATAMFVLVALGVAAALVTPTVVPNETAVATGIVATLVAFWLWWIANWQQQDLRSPADPDDPVGGDDPQADLSGNLAGYSTGRSK